MTADALTGHWRQLYENKYLGAWDLFIGGRYREVTVTIVDVRQERVVREGGQADPVFLLYLRGQKRDLPAPMIVSKTTGKTLQAMYGEIPAAWKGKSITLYAKQKRTKEGQAYVLTVRNSRASDALREELRERAAPRIEADEVDEGPVDPDKGP